MISHDEGSDGRLYSLATIVENTSAGLVGWESFDLFEVNDHLLRYRTMDGIEADWHKHNASDELFIILDGQLEIDVRDCDGHVETIELERGQTLVVKAGCEHRARAAQRASLLVLDRFTP